MRFDPSAWGGMQNQGAAQSGGWYKGYGNPDASQPGNNLGMGMGIMNNSMQPFPGSVYGNYSGMHTSSSGQQGEDGGYLDMNHYGGDGYPVGHTYQLGGWGMGSMLDESTPAWVPSSNAELS